MWESADECGAALSIDWRVTGDWHKLFYKFRRTLCTVRRTLHTTSVNDDRIWVLQIGSAIIFFIIIDVTIWCDNDSGTMRREREANGKQK